VPCKCTAAFTSQVQAAVSGRTFTCWAKVSLAFSNAGTTGASTQLSATGARIDGRTAAASFESNGLP